MLVLATIFISYRGADIGNLPALSESFAASLIHEKLFSPAGAAESLAGVLIALLIAASWYGLGDLICSGMRRLVTQASDAGDVVAPRSLEVAVKCAFGAGAWSLLWFAFGVAGLYTKSVAVAMLTGGLSLAAFSAARILKAARANEKSENNDQVSRQASRQDQRSSFVILGWMMIGVPLLLALISAIAPPTAKDALLYHISLPKAYVAAARLVDVPGNLASYLAHGAEMHGLWAMLTGELVSIRAAEAAFGATMFAFYPLLLVAVYGCVRERGLNRSWAITATAMIAAIPTVWHVAASGYVDAAQVLYLLLAVRATGQWWTSASRFSLITLSLALGFALAIKLTTVFTIFGVAVVILLKAREAEKRVDWNAASTGQILMPGMLALICSGLLASPWYLRTWAKTGSPVFPFYANLWKGSAPGWDTERSILFQRLNARYGGAEKSALDYLLTPVRLSLMAQPEQAVWYDGVLGISFLCGLALLLWNLRRKLLDAELKIACGVSAGLFFCWLFSSQQLRYLLPALPGLAITITCATAALAKNSVIKKPDQPESAGAIQWMLLATTGVSLLVICAWFLESNPLRVVLGGESRATYLERRLDYYSYYETVNSQLPADARVWLINMRRDSYHLERPLFSDYLFEDYTLTQYVKESKNLEELRARTRAAGITHLLVRHDVLLDYARTTVVDEQKSEAENREKYQLLKSFLTEGTRIMRSDARFMLIELPA